MRIAVLSDIHANLEALTAVLDRIAGLGVDRIVCLGDIVGYHADPNECVEIVRRASITSVLGNHDAAASGLEEPDTFNPAARQAVLWTRERLLAGNREFLRFLPRELTIGEFFLCHGSVHDTDQYIMTADDVRRAFALLRELPQQPHICFHGHTHVRIAFAERGAELVRESGDTLVLDREARYLVNPGSVGQPRDGDPRAAFLVWDEAARAITFFRVAYDVAACQYKVISAGLPRRFADRLAFGR